MHIVRALNPLKHRVSANEAHVRELTLYAENEEPLYRLRQDIERNLLRKMRAGKYEAEKAWKTWLYWFDEAARRYEKEYGSGRGYGAFTPADREQAAREWASATEREMRSGEYDYLLKAAGTPR